MRLIVAVAAAVLILGGTAAAAATTTQEVDGNLLVRGNVTVNRALVLRQSQGFDMPAGLKKASTFIPAIASAGKLPYFAVATIQGSRPNLWVTGAEVSRDGNATVWLNRAPVHDTLIGLVVFASDAT